jgi:hypothetical protein
MWQWPMLTFNLRQTQFTSQDLLLVLPLGLFCKILLAKLLVGLHLAVLGDGIVHDADNERLVVRKTMVLSMLGLAIC